MRSLFFFAALTVLIGADSRAEGADSELLVEFDAAVAKIALRSSGRPIRLPSLTFAVRIEASCAAPLETKSISISIADTRINVQPDDTGVIERSIRVPRKQLGPISVNDFCIAGDGASSEQELHLRDALSAQLSLHCSGDNQEWMTYETVALEVALQCDVPENAQSL
jgi:hypothetical protein